MKKLFCLVAFSMVSANAFVGTCDIVVYEKTPDCYVTQDSDGCLIIGNEKPKCDDSGKCVAKKPGCETRTKY